MAVVSGGTTLIDNGALDSAVPSGKLTLLSTQTASSSASISFTSGIDSTYDSYVFKFINIHPATDNVNFTVNFSTDGGSNYNVTKTSTYFQAYHNETNGVSALNYVSDRDLAQSTSDQQIANGIGSDNDQQASGYLHLYNPSNTTFVKHFITRFNIANEAQYSVDNYVAGYGNTTSSIDAVQFKMDSGNIDDGIIKMYGVG
jgi:hypothetical protein